MTTDTLSHIARLAGKGESVELPVIINMHCGASMSELYGAHGVTLSHINSFPMCADDVALVYHKNELTPKGQCHQFTEKIAGIMELLVH